MNYFRYKFMALCCMVGLLLVGATSCKDEGYEDVSGTASQTLWEVISSRSDLSSFAQVLRQNGYDKVLSSSGTYTVFAPGNQQMAAVAPNKQSEVPGAHIAPLGYNKKELSGMAYLTMINDRQTLLSELALTDEEIVCRNGFLRFSKAGARANQQNIYELLQELSGEYEMARFITSLGDSVMDKERSVQIGIDPVTNQPIYDTVMQYHNPLFEYVPYNENDSLLSVVLVDDATWEALIKRYYRYMRQHVDASANPNLMDPTKDTSFPFGSKIDSTATMEKTCRELIQDLSFSYAGAVARPSVNNPETVSSV